MVDIEHLNLRWIDHCETDFGVVRTALVRVRHGHNFISALQTQTKDVQKSLLKLIEGIVENAFHEVDQVYIESPTTSQTVKAPNTKITLSRTQNGQRLIEIITKLDEVIGEKLLTYGLIANEMTQQQLQAGHGSW